MAENLYEKHSKHLRQSRENCKIEVKFKSNLYCYIETKNKFVFTEIDKYFAKTVDGSWFNPRVRSGQWDGKKHFLTKLGRFPNGLLTELVKFCKEKNYPITFVNEYPYPKPIVDKIDKHFLKGVTLRDYQVDIVNKTIKYPLGIIHSATGTGKTEILTAIVKVYSNFDLILILVNQINLATQIVQRMYKRGLDNIGIIYGDEQDYHLRRIIVSTVQSIKKYPEIYQAADMILIDECKHTSANSFTNILKKSTAFVRYGFDATPFENTRGKPTLEAFEIKQFLGDIVAKLPTKEAIEFGVLTKPKIVMMTIKNQSLDNIQNYSRAYQLGIVDNKKRNNIVKYIVSKRKGKILILVKYIEHGKYFEKEIEGSIFMHGSMKSKQRDNAIQNFNNSNEGVLIGSTIFDEGIDFSAGIDTLIIASGGKSFKKTIQRLGRALRKNQRGVVEVYDFYDKGNPYLEKHSKSRLKAYQLEGHDVKII